MPKIAILFGILLIALGGIAFFGSDLTDQSADKKDSSTEATSEEPVKTGQGGDQKTGGKKRSAITGLIIPASFGTLLLIAGVAGLNEGIRKHAMHAAASIGLLGAVATVGKGSFDLYKLISGQDVNPRAMTFVWLMALICGIFVALCVKSFIDARKKRVEETAEA